MKQSSFEIRVCESCGLRYPLVRGGRQETRCPACLGQTHVKITRGLVFESTHHFPGNTSERFAVLLDNIRSAGNVGSILRSAEGFGFTHAYLCGITPTPENAAVRKTSLGAQDSVTWSYHKDAVKLTRGLKNEGMKIIALEEDKRAAPLSNAVISMRQIVLIVGNEITGVDPELLDVCHEILFIPMRGEKKSFNAAVAFGIAAHALTAPR